MSTRCQIGVYDEPIKSNKDLENHIALIYRHSDGYPEGDSGVIADLLPFLKWFENERGFDVEYIAARLLQYMCNKYDDHGKEWDKKAGREIDEKALTGLLGHGICNALHGDIEYFYAISEGKIKIYTTSWGSGFKDFKEIGEIDILKDEGFKIPEEDKE